MSDHIRETAGISRALNPSIEPRLGAKSAVRETSDEPINILLVDDEPKNLTVLESVLEDPHYRLVCAGSANEALLALVHEEFALLVLDIQMPGMNGFELAQMIKQRKKTADLPIIFLTAFYSEDQHVIEGYGTGAVDYLHKPINPVILRSKVSVFAELYRKTRALSSANRALLAEIAEREAAQEELRELARELEYRVSERTATLAQANAALIESDERLQLAQAAGGVGVWDWNIVTGDTFWSDAMWSIYGLAPVPPTRIQDVWRSLLHPDDRERIIDQASVGLASTDSTLSADFRIVSPDGAVRWVESVARITRDPHGVPIRMTGVNVDVTERKRTADRLRLTEERFQLALRNSRVLVYTTDRDLRYTWTSGSSPAFVAERILGRRDDELFSEDYAAPLMAIKRRVLGSGVREHGEFAIEMDGITRQYDLTVEPLANADGEFVGLTVAAMEITELKQAETALKVADRRKDEFLATLAHELRNPLAPIRTAAQILRLQGPSTPELQWAMDVIDRQSQQMTRLVDDLLDVARITTGKLALRMERIQVESIVQSAVETSRPLIEQCGHELQIRLPADPLAISGDSTRLSQVLSNLLNNAAKYTDPGGCIVLTAEKRGPHLVVSVRDTGVGIPAETLPTVFELFTQGDRHLERSQGGLGVGLALVKRLIELHGGSIEAHSAGLGQGSEFVVQLPLANEPASAARDHDNVQNSVGAQRLRILVVDDNQDNADCLQIMLGIMGHEARTAHDGLAAIAAAEEFRPEIVLLDLGMPKFNGYDVCAHIRDQPWGRQMVLIAQTGWGQDSDRRRTQAAGFDHHLVKPVKHETLVQLLATCGATPGISKSSVPSV